MRQEFASDGLTLVGHIDGLTATQAPRSRPAVVLVHGYPSGPSGTAGAVSAMPELADRIAADMGFVAFSPCLRGIGGSDGDFSIQGWADDIRAAVDHVRSVTPASGVWLVGFGTGGALAICAGADDPEVNGVAALGAPADFDDWASNPKRLVEHARELGMMAEKSGSNVHDGWTKELRALKAVDGAQRLSPRSLLVLHGTDDDVVPSFDARVIADSHTAAELHLLEGAGHRLRHDPRAMAITLGWLERQRGEVTRTSQAWPV